MTLKTLRDLASYHADVSRAMSQAPATATVPPEAVRDSANRHQNWSNELTKLAEAFTAFSPIFNQRNSTLFSSSPMIKITVTYTLGFTGPALEIRNLFCREAATKPIPSRNPLTETKFNDLLQRVAQEAFDKGRSFKLTES